ncbi:MAG: hypothetical protein HYV26_18450 [Candidatus Hydrogenedentes bacterium]|nr:hypothetical protein [Candidatus Hydrogenedentota bacterium]
MTIVPSASLGAAGPGAGEAVHYSWPLYLHVIRFLPWLLLPFLLLQPDNRGSAVWKALPPAYALQAIEAALEIWAPWAVNGSLMFLADEAILLAFSLTTLWLLSTYLARLPRPAAGFFAFLILGAAGLLYLIAWMELGLSSGGVGMLFMHGVLSAVIVLGFLLARALCRKRFTPGRFHLRLVGSLVGICLLPSPLFVLMVVFQGMMLGLEEIPFILSMFFGSFSMLAVVGVCAYVMTAIYLTLTFREPVLRQRFETIFGLHREVQPPPVPMDPGIAPA